MTRYLCLATSLVFACTAEQTSDSSEDTELPEPVVEVSVGSTHSCAWSSGEAATCWGESRDGQLEAPSTEFEDLDTGSFFSYGIAKSDGNLVSWGSIPTASTTPGSYNYFAISAGLNASCGIHDDHVLRCFGSHSSEIVQDQPEGGAWTQVEVGMFHACALDTEGLATCWGDPERVGTVPEDPMSQIAVGFSHACGLKLDREVVCWGRDLYGETQPPSGSFKAIAAGSFISFGITDLGSVVMWGYEDEYGLAEPLPRVFIDMDAYQQHACGVTEDQGVVCWGYNEQGQTDVPEVLE